jgi:hypothetical protein
MTREISGMPPGAHLIHRLAAAICPATQRQWVHAMFAELSAIEGSTPRMTWALGAASIALAAIEARAMTIVPFRIRAGIVVALCAGIGSSMLAYFEPESILIDDDVFVVLGVVATAALVGLAVIAVRTIFRGSEFAPGEA